MVIVPDHGEVVSVARDLADGYLGPPLSWNGPPTVPGVALQHAGEAGRDTEDESREEEALMRSKQLHEVDGLRTLAVVFDTDDEIAELLLDLAQDQGLTAASLAGIGAFRRVVLGSRVSCGRRPRWS